MKKKWPKEKTFFKDIYPAVWNQYMLKYDVINKIESRYHILLIISSVIIASVIQLGVFDEGSSILYVIPTLLISMVGLYSLLHVVPRKFYIPWMEIYEILDYEASNKFYRQMIQDTYTNVAEINEYIKDEIRILIACIRFITVSAFGYLILYRYFSHDYTSTVGFVILMIFTLVAETLLLNKENCPPGKKNPKDFGVMSKEKGYELSE